MSGCKRRHGSDTSTSSSSSTSSSESSESDISLPPAPDGGWGWVVVVASFMIHFIADGYAFSFGVLYTELLDYFQESKGKTAWVGSLFVSVPLLAGPVASALTNRFGCRSMTICGAVIASAGLVMSTFATNTAVLCVTFGLISGVGLSLVYVPAVVVVAFYFEKKRAFATGIAVAGSGIGNCVFAPLFEVLIQEYAWHGAVLILAAILLQMAVCGALFRPLLTPAQERKRKRQRLLSERSSKSALSSQSCDRLAHIPTMDTLSNGHVDDGNNIMTHSLVQFPTFIGSRTSFVTPDLLEDLRHKGSTLHEYMKQNNLLDRVCVTLPTGDQAGEVEGEVEGDGEEGGEATEEPETSVGEGRPNSSGQAQVDESEQNSTIPLTKQPDCSTDSLSAKPLIQRADPSGLRPRMIPGTVIHPLSRKDIFYRGNLLRPGASVVVVAGRAVSCPDLSLTRHTPQHKQKPGLRDLLTASREVISEMLDLSILRSGLFNYFCLSCSLLYLAYDVPYVYTYDKAVHELGSSQWHASLLLSIIGLASMFGQIVIGYLGDRASVDTLRLYNALTSVAGVATALVPLVGSYAWLAVYCGVYGFFISANYALTTIILVDLLGMDRLTNAYGLVMLAQGVANVVGPPAAGWLSDVTGGYNLTFISAGLVILLSGLMLFAIPCLRRRSRQHSDVTSSQSESSVTCSTEAAKPTESFLVTSSCTSVV